MKGAGLVVRGGAELGAKCDRIAGRIEQPSGASADLASIFQQRIERRFAGHGEGDWPGHAPATIERWGSHPLLQLSGALHSALTSGRVDVDGATLRYAPDAPFYGAIVSGRRPVMPDDPALSHEVAETLAEHIMGGE
jgi:hypothetical protein